MENLEQLRGRLIAEVAAAQDMAALEAVRIAALGKKGHVTGLMKTLGGLEAGERKAAGQALNLLKDAIAEATRSAGMRQYMRSLGY